jgi:hypothetical protein
MARMTPKSRGLTSFSSHVWIRLMNTSPSGNKRLAAGRGGLAQAGGAERRDQGGGKVRGVCERRWRRAALLQHPAPAAEWFELGNQRESEGQSM